MVMPSVVIMNVSGLIKRISDVKLDLSHIHEVPFSCKGILEQIIYFWDLQALLECLIYNCVDGDGDEDDQLELSVMNTIVTDVYNDVISAFRDTLGHDYVDYDFLEWISAVEVTLIRHTVPTPRAISDRLVGKCVYMSRRT
jgi:hypothetical protein